MLNNNNGEGDSSMPNVTSSSSDSRADMMMTQEDEGVDIGEIAKKFNPAQDGDVEMGEASSSSSDGDEVVKRFEVYLSHKLSDKLYLLQYPLRPKNNNYNFQQLKEVRFKPNHNKMEMDFEVNTRSEHYNTDSGQEYSTFSLSSTSVPVKANYAVGILRGNQLHLTPLWNMLQLRPGFQHINDGYSTGKSKVVRKKKGEEGEENGDKKNEAVPNASQGGGMNFRLQSDRKALERSYQFMKDQENNEKSINLALYSPQDSRQHIESLFEQRDDPVRFNVPPTAYLKQLVQYREEDQSAMAQGSLGAIKKIKLGERQVYYALYLAKILPFSKIRELSTRIKSDEEMLNALQRYGVFVDGRWVLKSEFNEKIIKLKDLDKNPWTCLKYPKTAAFREYLLYLFQTEKKVIRKKFVEKTGIEADRAKQLLEEVAVLKKVSQDADEDDELAAYWVLKYDVDQEFIDEFRSFAGLTVKQMWTKRELEINNLTNSNFRDLSILLHDVPKSNARGVGGATPNRFVASVESELKLFITNTLLENGVCSDVLLKKKKNENPSKYINNAKEEDFLKILDEVSIEFNNARIMKYRSDYSEKENKYREAIVKAFKENKYCLSKPNVKEVIKNAFNEDIPQNSFVRIMVELAINDATNKWHAKTGTEALKPSNTTV
ncbi:predicted protein [Naegleria gruberi]|uniref:Predicted protein n=1 Tax=Naegleria gruberi TaxID=5762 RepID=D2VT48_NAEGR|nr:uncharacterized protein NAEGRDRAFT_52042 [Naegleria gruberi]EFC40021.1 predicted protein [Naegleria gruberi]|eukprot:XP_002672765.1 predicted protein [Naegleria gruberi strain NEG-M]